MIGLNEVSLLGYLGDDPKITETASKIKCARFSIATSEVWLDKQSGEKKQKTEWHRIVAWRELAGIVERFCRKGSRIHLKGKLETSSYTDDKGIERWTTNIVADKIILLDRPPESENEQPANKTKEVKEKSAVVEQANNADDRFRNEDIPF